MNWSKAKTILMFFLIVSNLFLTLLLLDTSFNTSRVPTETLNNSVKLLAERAVAVDPSIIPTKIQSKTIYTLENVIIDYTEFAKKVLDENFKHSENCFWSDNKSVTFNGDSFSIVYNDGYATDKKLKTPKEKARQYLSEIGIDISDSQTKVSNDANGIFTVTFTKILSNMPLFDAKVTVELKGENITTVKGAWFNKVEASSTKSTLDSVPTLLVKYAAYNKEFSDIEISDITLGYSIGENSVFHKRANALPVYEIYCSDGRAFYIDAISN